MLPVVNNERIKPGQRVFLLIRSNSQSKLISSIEFFSSAGSVDARVINAVNDSCFSEDKSIIFGCLFDTVKEVAQMIANTLKVNRRNSSDPLNLVVGDVLDSVSVRRDIFEKLPNADILRDIVINIDNSLKHFRIIPMNAQWRNSSE